MLLYDTIAAVSTPAGEGGISIIRISGDKAIEILLAIRGENYLMSHHTQSIMVQYVTLTEKQLMKH